MSMPPVDAYGSLRFPPVVLLASALPGAEPTTVRPAVDDALRVNRTGRPTWIQWYDDLYAENQDLCRQIGNLVGYHFVLDQVTYPAVIPRGATASCTWSWTNDGVAPCYVPVTAAVALLDGAGAVVARQPLAGVDPRTWQPGIATEFTTTVTFPAVAPGDYRLAVGLLGAPSDAEPSFRIGNQGPTATGWYDLGPVRVTPE